MDLRREGLAMIALTEKSLSLSYDVKKPLFKISSVKVKVLSCLDTLI